jgi:uncharacterized damage-inducible protein DinB
MTICQSLTTDFENEMKRTRQILERVEPSKYKPHEKSMALDYLASHVADIPSWYKFILETQSFHIPSGFKYEVKATREELLEYFDKNVNIAREWIAKVTDEEMAKDWTFSYGDIFTMTQPRVEAIRETLNHLIHHRAQLGVYLRLLNVPIPGMYGPSADDVWK